jgi:hypothetical protein
MSFTKIPNILPNIYYNDYNNKNDKNDKNEIKKLKNEIVLLKEQIKLLTELILMDRNKGECSYVPYISDNNLSYVSYLSYISYVKYMFPIPLYFLYKMMIRKT